MKLKSLIHIFINAHKTISHHKMNSILIFLVLIVSFTCSLFTLAMGSAEVEKRESNSQDARRLIFQINETDMSKIKPLFEQLKANELISFVLAGETTEKVETYSNSGVEVEYKTSLVASDLFETTDNFSWLLSVPRKIESGQILFVGNSFNTDLANQQKYLNEKPFNIENADVSHTYFSDIRNGNDMYFLNTADFYKVAERYTHICIMFKEIPSDETLENVLNVICENIEPTDVIMPKIPSGMQVDRTKTFFAFGLLLLSFINIQSAFVFLCSTRKTEYKIYRKYGATKSFIAFDVFGMIFTFIIISFIISVAVYSMITPLLSVVGANYPASIVTIIILFMIAMLMSGFSTISCVKEVKKYEAR